MIAHFTDALGRPDTFRCVTARPEPHTVSFLRPVVRAGPADRAVLAALADVEGVFAANDRMADGALAMLHAAGRAVPDDVAVVGFDDSTVAAGAHPPLTTEPQPVEDMGGAMARLLLAAAADVPRVHEVTQPRGQPSGVAPQRGRTPGVGGHPTSGIQRSLATGILAPVVDDVLRRWPVARVVASNRPRTAAGSVIDV